MARKIKGTNTQTVNDLDYLAVNLARHNLANIAFVTMASVNSEWDYDELLQRYVYTIRATDKRDKNNTFILASNSGRTPQEAIMLAYGNVVSYHSSLWNAAASWGQTI
jgi:hypothetical protein